MKKNTIKSRLIWAFGASAALLLCYIISRHDVLGAWHGMRQWPVILLTTGLAVIIISAFADSRKVMICVPVGYLAGFVFAALFNTDGWDAGGGATNDGWKIWTVSLLVLIISGIVWEIVNRFIVRKRIIRRR